MAARAHVLSVRFTEPAEYLAELKRDRDLVERGIIRVALVQHAAGPAGVLIRLRVVAGAIVEGRPVIFERIIGDLWGQQAADAEVLERAQRIKGELEDGLIDLGLEVRGGTLDRRIVNVEGESESEPQDA